MILADRRVAADSRQLIETTDLKSNLEDISTLAPDSISIVFEDGALLTETVSKAPGGSNQPLSIQDIYKKYTQGGGCPRIGIAILNGDSTATFEFE
jgi:hypothetical protein